MADVSAPFRILALDGGGSKGVYSLGVLQEVEHKLGKRLHEHFHLIFGTSTGAIIAALCALGESVEDISNRYFEMVPSIMRRWTKAGRTRALIAAANHCFEEKRFDAFRTLIGIVATNFEYRRPMIFKNSQQQAHGLVDSFVPGFGCTIAEAVIASCAAYPLFVKAKVSTTNQGDPELIDGGFVANNPTLFAIADALQALKIPKERLRVLSVGVGRYPEKPPLMRRALSIFPSFEVVDVTFAANTNTLEIIRNIMFRDIRVVRVDGAFTAKEYRTNLLEHDLGKLRRLKNLGRESYRDQEKDISALLE